MVHYELLVLRASWLARLWLAGSVLLGVFLLASGWASLPTPELTAVLLFPYLVFPWFPVVMILGVDPVTGARLDTLADGILSRPVTRVQYVLASWTARLLVVLGVFLAGTVPLTAWLAFARRHAGDGITLFGVAAALSVSGLVLALQMTLGFLFGTVLRRPLLAAVLLLFVWYPWDVVLHRLELEEFSTISLSQAMPELVRAPAWGRPNTVGTGPSREIQASADQAMRFLSGLGGLARTPERKPGFFQNRRHEDLSLSRVALGYGLPTALALALALLCFCRRDL